jgi:uncharacterized protein YndB with AHSA1/START domain
MSKEIRLSTWIAATPEKVWRAIEREEYVRRWLGWGDGSGHFRQLVALVAEIA